MSKTIRNQARAVTTVTRWDSPERLRGESTIDGFFCPTSLPRGARKTNRATLGVHVMSMRGKFGYTHVLRVQHHTLLILSYGRQILPA